MVLTTEQLKDILKNRPNATVINAAINQSKKLKAHITGIGKDNLLTEITGLENSKQLELRKKYSRSNKDIFARIHRPEDKIFSAKGSSHYYDISESSKAKYSERLLDVYNGFSARKWVEVFAMQYLHIDPMGLVFMEVKDSKTYPTYKSSYSIFDYKLKGRELEYVIFRTENKDEFRVVDDEEDKIVRFENDFITTITDSVYTNYFKKVPALIISDILNKDSEYFTSPDWEVIEIADEYLRECSVKSIYKLRHGFPKAWQYVTVCNTCKGSGMFKGETCESCNGMGKAITKDTSEIVTLPIPLEGQPTIAPNVAGYVSPDIAGWDKMTDELLQLENLMNQTYWGTHQKEDTSNETATGRFIDVQPVNDRLSKFSKWASNMESFIANSIGKLEFETTFKKADINYGTRYLIETPDEVWKKYEKARQSGAPISTLDDLLLEYYESKYQNNPVLLAKYVKLMKIEPFVHQTISECKNTVLNPIDYDTKLYFSEWLNSIDESDILNKNTKELTIMLTDYVKNKQPIN